jgi:hypothetical protein
MVGLIAADALVSLRGKVERRGVVVARARVKQDLRDDLERAGSLEAWERSESS